MYTKKSYFWLEGARKGHRCCHVGRSVEPPRSKLCYVTPCPPPLPSIRALEKREFLVLLLLSLLLCLKLMNTKIETHCFIRLMLSLRGSVRFSIQLMSKCYLLTKIVFMNWKRCPISVIVTIPKRERPYFSGAQSKYRLWVLWKNYTCMHVMYSRSFCE